MSEIDAIRTAILEGAPGDEIGALPVPEAVRGALVRLVRAPDKPVEEIEVRSKGGNGAKIRAEGYRRRPKEGSEHEHPEHRD